MSEISAWRVNDVVVYEAARDAASTLTSVLVDLVRGSDSGMAASARAELAEWRVRLLTVDAYDRAAVQALTSLIASRIGELAGVSA